MRALRTFLMVVMILGSRGMFLHYVGGDCWGDEKCPICQQFQGSPAEDVPLCIGCMIDWASCLIVAPPAVALYCCDDVCPISPRAPPA